MEETFNCPICGEETGHLNNHVRMKNGAGHGPATEYPPRWDKEAGGFPDGYDPAEEAKSVAGDGASSNGETVDMEPDPSDGDGFGAEYPGMDMDSPQAFDIDDLLSETREYECGECGEPVEYLGGEQAEGGGKKCPSCGEHLQWSAVEP